MQSNEFASINPMFCRTRLSDISSLRFLVPIYRDSRIPGTGLVFSLLTPPVPPTFSCTAFSPLTPGT